MGSIVSFSSSAAFLSVGIQKKTNKHQLDIKAFSHVEDAEVFDFVTLSHCSNLRHDEIALIIVSVKADLLGFPEISMLRSVPCLYCSVSSLACEGGRTGLGQVPMLEVLTGR